MEAPGPEIRLADELPKERKRRLDAGDLVPSLLVSQTTSAGFERDL